MLAKISDDIKIDAMTVHTSKADKVVKAIAQCVHLDLSNK